MLCCESTTDERSAGNPHATFCGSRGLGPRRPGRTGNVTGLKYGDTRRRKGEQTGNTNLNLTQTRQSPTPLKTLIVHDIVPGSSVTARGGWWERAWNVGSRRTEKGWERRWRMRIGACRGRGICAV